MFVVTGASSGIGQAAALALARRSRKVLAVGRNVDRLRLLVGQHPEFIQSVVADLAIDSGILAVADRLQSSENVDGIVHGAGSPVPLSSYHDLDCKDLSQHFSVHVAAPIALNNCLREKLVGARILYIDSYSANSPRVGWAAYSIVKSAAQMAARLASAEMRDSTVIRVFPGGVRTPLVEAVLQSTTASEVVDIFRKMDSEGKLSEADVVGEFLANILLSATEDDINSRECWDFGNAADHIFN